VDGVPLDRGRPSGPRVFDRAVDERVRDALLAAPWPHPNPPQGPHVEIVHVRDPPVAREARADPRMHGSPPDRSVAAGREYPWRRILSAQLAHAVGPSRTVQRVILRAAEAITQAEAHVGCRLL